MNLIQALKAGDSIRRPTDKFLFENSKEYWGRYTIIKILLKGTQVSSMKLTEDDLLAEDWEAYKLPEDLK